VALVSGVICGVAVAAVSPKEESVEAETCTDECCQPHAQPALQRMLSYGFISLPRSISKAVVLGIILSGIISGLIPSDFFADRMGNSPVVMLVMLAIGIPLYVCSSASVPIALAFIKAGISPGAALVFLITGPATNAATLTTLWQIIGKKQLVIFLITLAVCALVAGVIMNMMNLQLGIGDAVCAHDKAMGSWSILAAILLILVLAKGILPQKQTEKAGSVA
jgi:uncharacterized membrane protein YraQ (UPF0718 family)